MRYMGLRPIRGALIFKVINATVLIAMQLGAKHPDTSYFKVSQPYLLSTHGVSESFKTLYRFYHRVAHVKK